MADTNEGPVVPSTDTPISQASAAAVVQPSNGVEDQGNDGGLATMAEKNEGAVDPAPSTGDTLKQEPLVTVQPPKDDQSGGGVGGLAATELTTPTKAAATTTATNISEKEDGNVLPQTIESKPGNLVTDDNVLDAANDNESQKKVEQKQNDAPATPAAEPSIANSKSAQLLMNRFSTWRERTSEKTQSLLSSESTQSLWNRSPALKENARALWQQGTAHTAMTRLSAIAGSGITAKKAEDPAEKQVKVTEDTAEVSKSASEESEISSPDNGLVTGSDVAEENDSGSGDDGEEDESAGGSDDNSSSVEDNPENAESRVLVGAAVSKAAAAASVVAESVATNFRGRYVRSASAPAEVPDPSKSDRPKSAPESQTALILKSRAAKHMQEILDSLEDHEFAMLLGSGMLGVNLKQCYLRNHGVFIDYLVAGGQAQLSGVIRSGDLLVRLGDLDMRKGTIAEIPQKIAIAKRPVVLVMAMGTRVAVDRVNYLDVAVAMMHRSREINKEQRGLESLSNVAEGEGKGQGQVEEPGSMEKLDSDEPTGENSPDLLPQSIEVSEGRSSPPGDGASKPRVVSRVAIPSDDSLQYFETPPLPPLAVRKEFAKDSALRCYDKFLVTDLCDLAAADSNFRAAVKNAFLTCATDSRRLPFLARYLSSEENVAEGTGSTETMAPSAQLMLFLELTSFIDLYGVTPLVRLRDIAKRIAHKFFLPTNVDNRLQPPLFDFHHIVADSSLRHLEFVLGGKSSSIPRDIFLDFQKAVVDSLTGAPFLSFLASSECCRMRGYLRDTAPYVNLPLQSLFEALAGDDIHSGAKNSFAFMLVFLICQLEKEQPGEYDFSEAENNRLLGAASGVCCVVYIRRTLLPAIEGATKRRNGEVLRQVIQAWENVWDQFVAPSAGSLDAFTKSIETESALDAVRELLEKAGDAADPNCIDALETVAPVVDALLDPKLTKEVRRLADELLYDYAVNVHTKFREHKCHEWMCSELCKMRAGDPTWTNTGELPMLPQGCIKRLLRKTEFPAGVSPHKPSYRDTAPCDDKNKRKTPDEGNVNADYAVVFGTSVGDDLAAQMPIPGIEHSDIRRYACLPVNLDRNQEQDTFSEDPIPPTFESYAIGPRRKPKPFSKIADDMRFSADGWEVSLVSFTIPNGESSSGDAADSALFGVSLVFQETSRDEIIEDSNATKTKLIFQQDAAVNLSADLHTPEKKSDDDAQKEVVYDSHGSAIDVHNFASPITFETPMKPARTETTEETEVETTRMLKVSSMTPTFNKRLQEHSWVDRAEDAEEPLSIGIALVSRRNVVPAMRDTLSRLLHDFSRGPENAESGSKAKLTCRALVDVLGAFSYQDVETTSLCNILEPYLRSASAPWLGRPIDDQRKAFETTALKHLTHCLTPTPLALLFVTALLEQKIVLSSSRRSVLHSASVALVNMLRPLKWSHLLVPLVPSALANDLLQYPAPFILGIPSEEKASMDLLNNLPNDVTLVDLDVGRVILAPAFALDNEMVRGTEDAAMTARALRSQVLYLAQALGSAFGACLSRDAWCCDTIHRDNGDGNNPSQAFDNFRSLIQSFIQELLSGLTSCCYWVEEATNGYATSEEPTVLFDEDRFFHLKNVRATKRAKSLFARKEDSDFDLSLDDFDLIVESFLRVQSISTYISSRDKTEMLYY